MLVEKTYTYIYYEMEKDCCRNVFKLKMTVYSALINTIYYMDLYLIISI